MKITIVGAGAIGGVIGAFLARGGRQVELVDVVDQHVQAINEKGLAIIESGEILTAKVKAYTPFELLQKNEKLECVILCVKCQDTKGALLPLIPLLDDNGYVLSLQNGLCEIEIAALVGRQRTVGGFVNIFADYEEPGVISYGGRGALSIGELDGEVTPRIKALAQEMSVLEQIVVTDNIFGLLWGKLAYGAILAATALTNETMDSIIEDRHYRDMLMNLAAEILAVADKEGVKPVSFDDWYPDDAYPREVRDPERMDLHLDAHVKRLKRYSKVRSGIWRDIAVRNRKTEKHAHFAQIFKIADEAQVDMPLCRLLLEMLSELENKTRPFSKQNLEELLILNNRIYPPPKGL